jgi:hypothetical protein
MAGRKYNKDGVFGWGRADQGRTCYIPVKMRKGITLRLQELFLFSTIINLYLILTT